MEMLFLNTNKKKSLEAEVNQRIMQQSSDNEEINKLKNKNSRTLDTFLSFITIIQEKDCYKSLHIDGRKVELNLDSEKLDYKALIKEIEMKNKFIVKQIVFTKDENKGDIKISMELK